MQLTQDPRTKDLDDFVWCVMQVERKRLAVLQSVLSMLPRALIEMVLWPDDFFELI